MNFTKPGLVNSTNTHNNANNVTTPLNNNQGSNTGAST